MTPLCDCRLGAAIMKFPKCGTEIPQSTRGTTQAGVRGLLFWIRNQADVAAGGDGTRELTTEGLLEKPANLAEQADCRAEPARRTAGDDCPTPHQVSGRVRSQD
jgi:hypothetical protein